MAAQKKFREEWRRPGPGRKKTLQQVMACVRTPTPTPTRPQTRAQTRSQTGTPTQQLTRSDNSQGVLHIDASSQNGADRAEKRPLLCFLPEELLLEIMSHLPPCGLQLLRSTCSMFFRLSMDKRFSRFNPPPPSAVPPVSSGWPGGYGGPPGGYGSLSTMPPSTHFTSIPWRANMYHHYRARRAIHQSSIINLPYMGTSKDKARLKMLLLKDRLCSDCFDIRFGDVDPMSMDDYAESAFKTRFARLLNSNRKLCCSVCKTKHARVLFSSAQRQAHPRQRKCIGAEGTVKMCQHKKITWDDMRNIANMSVADPVRSDLRLIGTRFRIDCTEPGSVCRPTFWVEVEHNKPVSMKLSSDSHPVNSEAARRPLAGLDVKTVLTQKLHAGMVQFRDMLCPHLATANGQCSVFFERTNGHPAQRLNSACGTLLPPDEVIAIEEFGRVRAHIGCSVCSTIVHGCLYPAVPYGQGPAYGGLAMHISRSACFLPAKAVCPDWLVALDPESFNFREDLELENIAWCEDEKCAVNKGYMGMTHILQTAWNY